MRNLFELIRRDLSDPSGYMVMWTLAVVGPFVVGIYLIGI